MDHPAPGRSLPVLVPSWSLPSGVRALCTLRAGGVSRAPYDELNLGLHVQDDPAHVHINRQRLAQACGARPVFLEQVHGTACVHLDAQTPDAIQADACWTAEPGVVCTIMVADCLPVLMCDTRGRAVAAAHAGWRGLGAGVLEATLQTLCEGVGCSAAEVQVWLGPCIGPTAFEVGDDVLRAWGVPRGTASPWFKPAQLPGKWLADLAGAARQRLQQAGVVRIDGNDSTPDWCTVTQSARFFSHRRDGRSGRFAACIWRQTDRD